MRDTHAGCDILFVNPPSPDGYIYIRDINRSGRRTRELTLWPQTSLAYLAAVAKQAGYKVDLLDCIAEEISWNEYLDYVKKYEPKWTVVQAITSVVTNDVYATYLGKRYNSRTVVVGPHITALPRETMEAFPSVDFGILGEPEETLREMLDAVERGGDLRNIKGMDASTIPTTVLRAQSMKGQVATRQDPLTAEGFRRIR
jgi:radical SAM superfamily enzyme YgiQ (UPF0313 family)